MQVVDAEQHLPMSSGDETVLENVFNDDEVAEDQEEDLLDDESYTALK